MKISLFNTLEISPEALIIPATEDKLQQVLTILERETGISAALIQKDFKGKKGDVHSIYCADKRRILVGLGEAPDFHTILRTFRKFSHNWKDRLSPTIGLSLLHDNGSTHFESQIEAMFNGLLLGTYQIGQFKTEQEDTHPLKTEDAEIQLFIEENKIEAAQKAAEKGKAFAETQLSIFDLVNAPSNKKLPIHLSQWAQRSGTQFGFNVQVLEKKAIEELGLYALLAVNQGSAHPPTFTIMEYKPNVPSETTLPVVGLVGKGVTFDTGGLSIKPSTNMHLMKSDMGGAAAVFGTMEMAAKLQLPVHLYGIVPATDNSVDAMAVKPSDVIDSYSGKTIEIIDTDAEGRLILSDGIAYMLKHFRPDVLIDLATLTGSAVRALGYHAAALFSKNEELATQLYQTGLQTGEKVWRLPLWDVYKDDLKSDVADIKNFSGKPIAGAIAAAKFLEFFTEEHPSWAHLDIAGVAFSDMEFSSQKSSTAYGVRLLTEYLQTLAKG